MSERWTDTAGTVHQLNPECHNSGCQALGLHRDIAQLERERDELKAQVERHRSTLTPMGECSGCVSWSNEVARLEEERDAAQRELAQVREEIARLNELLASGTESEG